VIDHFRAERKDVIDQLLNASRRVGELETKLLQISPHVDGNAAQEGNAIDGDAVFTTEEGQY